MLLSILAFLAVALMALAYAFKRPAMALGATGVWIIFAVQSYTLSTALWDIYYTVFFVGIGVGLISLFEAMSLRGKTKDEEEEQEEEEEKSSLDKYMENQEKIMQRMDKYEELMSSPSDRRKRKESRKVNTRLE